MAEVLLQKAIRDCENRGEPVTEELKEQLKENANKEQATMKDCLHSVRIGFQGRFTDLSSGNQYLTPMILSDSICNSRKLRPLQEQIASYNTLLRNYLLYLQVILTLF